MNELQQKQRAAVTGSPSILGKEQVCSSGRLSSGSASSSVGGSTSSLDSKANPEQLQLQLDRRMQQTYAPASPTTCHAQHLSASAERVRFCLEERSIVTLCSTDTNLLRKID